MFAGGHIYREYLEALIKSYRAHFSNANLPFFVVEIPYYGSHYIWSDLRDSQRFTANRLNAVHLVSILDIGDLKDIHPPKKPELGARLAAVADRFVYGGKDALAMALAVSVICATGTTMDLIKYTPLNPVSTIMPIPMREAKK